MGDSGTGGKGATQHGGEKGCVFITPPCRTHLDFSMSRRFEVRLAEFLNYPALMSNSLNHPCGSFGMPHLLTPTEPCPVGIGPSAQIIALTHQIFRPLYSTS